MYQPKHARQYPAPTVLISDDMAYVITGLEDDGEVTATDGCLVQPDGECEHGHPSWLIEFGMI